MKKELLSPVGNMESLKAAIHHGADAVYLGGKKFGARAFATNFTDEEMQEAVFLCHLYGVKIYVTVNTMIYESELKSALEYVEFLYLNHVDAVIMADIGLMKLCHERFPDLEIHASTQVHTHNVEQLAFLKELGVKRVVLARELSLEEIQKFPDDLELEVFIHGALCISYSGQCLFSSLIMDRSGNRGECAQICRLPFTLLKNGKPVSTKGQYLLSTRDLNTSTRMKELCASSIRSFKIEGRMKSPAYVGFMTQMYRQLIDRYELGKSISDLDTMNKKASVLFGRGFTEGCLFHKKDQEFMNQNTSNHQGIYLGEIEILTPKKVGIRLSEELHQEDGIRFIEEDKGMIVNFLYDTHDFLISKAQAGDLIFVDNKVGLTKKGKVMKTLDFLFEKEIMKYSSQKIPITMTASIKVPFFSLSCSDGIHTVSIREEIVSVAKNYPITKEKVQEQLNRLGNTPFEIQDISIDMEQGIYINIKSINEIRRRVVDLLIQKRIYRKTGRIFELTEPVYTYDDTLEIYAMARTEEQLLALLELGVQGIYVSDDVLYEKYSNHAIIYRTNRVSHRVVLKNNRDILAGESGSFGISKGKKSTDYFFNVANHATADFWHAKGATRICLTPEMKTDELDHLLRKYPHGNPFEWIIYGRLEVMVLQHCILRCNMNHDAICQVCKDHSSFALQDRNGFVYPIQMDENHRTHIFHCKNLNLIPDLSQYYAMGLRKFRLEFFDESAAEVRKVVKQVQNELRL